MKKFKDFINEGKEEDDEINRLLDRMGRRINLTDDEKKLLSELSGGKKLKDCKKHFGNDDDPFGEDIFPPVRNNHQQPPPPAPVLAGMGDRDDGDDYYNDHIRGLNKDNVVLYVHDDEEFLYISFWERESDIMVDYEMSIIFPELNDDLGFYDLAEGEMEYEGHMDAQELKDFLREMGFEVVDQRPNQRLY